MKLKSIVRTTCLILHSLAIVGTLFITVQLFRAFEDATFTITGLMIIAFNVLMMGWHWFADF
jgi:hypothetical protein